MWIKDSVIETVNESARVFYIDAERAWAWNEKRDADDLRLMCGWAWQAKDGSLWDTGIRSKTEAYIKAYEALTHTRRASPLAKRARLTVVHQRKAA